MENANTSSLTVISTEAFNDLNLLSRKFYKLMIAVVSLAFNSLLLVLKLVINTLYLLLVRENEKGLHRKRVNQENKISGLIKLMARIQVYVFTKSKGKYMKTFFGSPVMILTTVGRKSGQLRSTPLIYVKDGERIIIAASKIGHVKPPAWQHNVEANPLVEAQVGTKRSYMEARKATESEEENYWPELFRVFPEYRESLKKTQGIRHIPIFILEPSV